MNVDWYSSLVAQKKDTVEKRINEGDSPRSDLMPVFAKGTEKERWFTFFEGLSLLEAYFQSTGGSKQAIREVYFERVSPSVERRYDIPEEGRGLSSRLSLEPDPALLKSALECLPSYSWFLHFRFTLASPYLSKDDAPFYVIDNPVRKDKVFKLPMVSPTSWKGGLRAALRRVSMDRDQSEDWSIEKERQNPEMMRLFGNVKGEEEQDQLRAGRLHFFPTFFDAIGQEVINPHDREGGAGDQPIYFECVPEETEGTFTLLYIPFDTVGKPEGWRDPVTQQSPRKMAILDMVTVAYATARLLTLYGFGAKTSSGFGTAYSRFSSPDDADDKTKGGLLCFRDSDQTRCWPTGGFHELVHQAFGFHKQAEGVAS
jgi:CRISPR/Cas system CMR subunit Cmr6 (Cas7 group RAMP superfamily)